MAEPVYSPELNAKKTAASAFLGTLVTSAKTALLYKPGHPSIAAIATRTIQVLQRSLGQETTLTLDIKAKTVALEESELAETPEIVAFAAALHTLGIGQILFTNRIAPEGMVELFKILAAKPDDKNSLTHLQKAVQQVRIDGLQMVFILNFIVTGEQEQVEQKPGQLTEEQVLAFIRARTLSDFLALLLRQNEELHGKEAEAVTILLDDALHRDIPLEKLEAELPWSLYDPRIKARYDEHRAAAAWAPKAPRARRAPWSGPGIVSWAGFFENADLKRMEEHHAHDKVFALKVALPEAKRLLDAANADSPRKYAGYAYARLIGELARDGGIGVMILELPRWKALVEGSAIERALALMLKDKVCCMPAAERLIESLGSAALDPSDPQTIEFCVFAGEEFLPMLLDCLRGVQDKEQRARLCVLLGRLAQRLGDKAIVAGLRDEDWFLVVNCVGILSELGLSARVAEVAPLLKHGHRKVREGAVKFLGKFGGSAAVDALAEFAAAGKHPEEVGKAVITLSLLSDAAVGAKLIEAYGKTQSYQTKVALVRALSRFPGADSVRLLTSVARRNWYEVLSGLNKELRQAARESLEQYRKEGKA